MVKAAENFNYLVFCYDNEEKDHSKLRSFKKGDTLPEELVNRLSAKGPKYWMEGGLDKKSVDKTSVKTIISKPPKYTEKELIALTKKQQVTILNKLGIEEIPRLEKDRVALILEKQ